MYVFGDELLVNHIFLFLCYLGLLILHLDLFIGSGLIFLIWFVWLGFWFHLLLIIFRCSAWFLRLWFDLLLDYLFSWWIPIGWIKLGNPSLVVWISSVLIYLFTSKAWLFPWLVKVIFCGTSIFKIKVLKLILKMVIVNHIFLSFSNLIVKKKNEHIKTWSLKF